MAQPSWMQTNQPDTNDPNLDASGTTQYSTTGNIPFSSLDEGTMSALQAAGWTGGNPFVSSSGSGGSQDSGPTPSSNTFSPEFQAWLNATNTTPSLSAGVGNSDNLGFYSGSSTSPSTGLVGDVQNVNFGNDNALMIAAALGLGGFGAAAGALGGAAAGSTAASGAGDAGLIDSVTGGLGGGTLGTGLDSAASAGAAESAAAGGASAIGDAGAAALGTGAEGGGAALAPGLDVTGASSPVGFSAAGANAQLLDPSTVPTDFAVPTGGNVGDAFPTLESGATPASALSGDAASSLAPVDASAADAELTGAGSNAAETQTALDKGVAALKAASNSKWTLPALGTALSFYQQKKGLDAQKQISAVAQQSKATSDALLAKFNSGQLTSADQSAIATWSQQAKAQINQYYQKAGLGSSAMAASALSQVDQQADQMRQAALTSELNSGLKAAGISDPTIVAGIKAGLAQDTEAAQALQTFFGAIAKVNTPVASTSGG